MLLHGRAPAMCLTPLLPGAVTGGVGSIPSKWKSGPKCCMPEILTPHAPQILGYHTTEVKSESLLDNSAAGRAPMEELCVTSQPGIKQIPAAMGEH